MEDIGFEVFGMNDFKFVYISDIYGLEIVYDWKFVCVVNCDIEVIGDKFFDLMKVEYEIDVIIYYDLIDDCFYVFDFLNLMYGLVLKWDVKLVVKFDCEGGDEVF